MDKDNKFISLIKNFKFKEHTIGIAFIALFLLAVIVGWPNFIKFRNLTNILRQISYTGVIALGMTLVIISGGTDLSVGSMACFVGGITIYFLNMFGKDSIIGVILTVVFSIVLGGICGFLNGIIITQFRLAPFIVTLGTMSIFRSLIQYFSNAGNILSVNMIYGKIGFNGVFLIEPKPMEPSKHQYDYDAATAIGFIKENGLDKDFKCNIEANHATLAGHTFAHDLQVCADNGMLGSVDANQGDAQNGWDTDEFPSNVYETVQAMRVILNNGGLHSGGLNFDAKRRRNSTDIEDLFISHIGGMDSFALGLEIASRMKKDGAIDNFIKNRYASFDKGMGKKFENNELNLESLADYGKTADIVQTSGKQELLNNILNSYLFG
jgi:hypothetical protein